ncbi:MAG TPA: hypothetical protein PKY59_27065 [Pyrinomonadaceae bacterium]|nr:hypothetical protein [Pyrinomonadaceae bacterium]
MFENELIQKFADFLNGIGLKIHPKKLDEKTFLKGILIENGEIFVDENLLDHPGDILHEAGHIATAPAAIRPQLSDTVTVPDSNMDTMELAAMLWSYAAAVHLQIDPRIVFHPHGYYGRSESILFNFSLGMFMSISILEEAEMAYGQNLANQKGLEIFPKMYKWLRD